MVCAQSIAIRERAFIFLDQQLKIKNIFCCDVYKIYTFTFISAFRGKDNDIMLIASDRHILSYIERRHVWAGNHVDCEWHVKKLHVWNMQHNWWIHPKIVHVNKHKQCLKIAAKSSDVNILFHFYDRSTTAANGPSTVQSNVEANSNAARASTPQSRTEVQSDVILVSLLFYCSFC